MREKICGIYKITSPTNRIYIGQARDIYLRWKSRYQQPENKLYFSDQPKLYNSILKYGWKTHKFEIIDICSLDELNNRETYWVAFYSSYSSVHGMNCTYGGDGGNGIKWTEESKKRASDSKKKMYLYGYVSPLIGTKLSEDRKIQISKKMTGTMVGDKNTFYGKKHSEETKKIIGEKSMGRAKPEDFIERLKVRMRGAGNPMYGKPLVGEKNGMYGKNHSEESKRKMANKTISPEHKEMLRILNTGRKASDETREKLSRLHKGNKYNVGRKQSLETINKKRIAMTGRKASPDSIQRMRIAQKGRTVSEKTKENLRVLRSKLVVNLSTGIFYNSSEDAWMAYGIQSLSCFKHKLIGRIKNNTSYIYA